MITFVTRDDVFVGRGQELDQLSAAFEEALGGRGRLILLSGEPGIGKSRLVDEFASRARESGVLLWGRCWEAGGAPPYWPWVQLLRTYLRARDAESVRADLGTGAIDVAQMLPEIRELFPDLPSPLTVDPDSARFQLFDSATSFLLNASRREPLVLVLEDLHAADTPSLLLLQFLADQIGDARLLALATYRDVEITPEHPLTSAVADLSREPTTRRIHLLGLTKDDVIRFVAAVAGTPAPPQLVTALHRETSGNPLFLGEAVRLLAAEGRLGLSDPATLRIAVPKGVRDVIGRRLNHLDEQCKRVLSTASVLGTEFSTEALRRLSDRKPDEVLDDLDRAARAGLVGVVSGSLGRFRFSHEVVRETLYEELTSANRMQLHSQAAQVLRQLYATDEVPHLAELAHHFFEAAPLGDTGNAVDFARRAGEEAVRSLAYEEAARLYGMALHALELGEPVDQIVFAELLLAQGDAQARAGDLPSARETFLRAAQIARRTGSAGQLARAALGYGGRFLWARVGDDAHLVPMLQDALVLLGGSDDRLRVRLLTRLACALRSEPDRTLSATLSQQAVDMARQLADPATLGYALVGRLWAIYWPENPEERLALADEIIRVSEAGGDGERAFDGYQARCMTLIDLGDIAEARVALSRLERRAEELRQPAQWWAVWFFRAFLALVSGEFDRAEELIALEMRPGLPANPAHDDVSVHAMHTFLLRREQGRLAEAEQTTRAAIEQCPWYPVHRAALVCILHQLGREMEARAIFDDLALDDFGALQRDSEWLLGIALTSEASAILGDADRASTLYEQVLPFERRHAHVIGEGSLGAMDRYLGLLARTMGQLEAAEKHFRVAIEMNERMGARPWTAHSRYDLAELLLERGGPADRERAIEEFRLAGEFSQEMGMTALADHVARRLGELGVERIPEAEPALRTGLSVFRREGEYWTVAFDGDAFRLKDSKGLQYLAKLLAAPGRDYHVLDLVVAGDAARPKAAEVGEPRSRADALGHAGALLDPEAKEAYRRRLSDLEEDIESAEAMGDADRAERARSEREFIARELAAAVGLGGRDRVAASASERARVNVTRAVKSTLARIAAHSPALGSHLEKTVKTGTYCSYEPDPRIPVNWQL
jgi:tetratricopeptide (TPR) repeat protein